MFSLKNTLSDPTLFSLITSDQAWHYRIIPQKLFNGTAYFLIDHARISNDSQVELELLLDTEVKLEESDSSMIESLLNKYYPKDIRDSRLQNEYFDGDPDSFLEQLICEAKGLKSSDIHIEIYDDACRVRIRIDGMLLQRYLLKKDQYPALINRIKIISNLDISEKRLPQDGRILFGKDQNKFDIRVSVLPTLHGEKVVLRLLNNDATNIEITTLGFTDHDLKNYLEGIKKPNGILLISGPTGSGKTTTLYATLKILNKSTRNILTIEDPIEYTLDGVNQVQLKESIGLNFSTALRTFLRQDPDVIMLGEIRDADTASMAIRAALTGHLVLSTIHTNSAWGTISRLIDMGMPPFLIANTINTSVAQRLIRLLCPSCKKQTYIFNEEATKRIKSLDSIDSHFEPVGCRECHDTGYRGRKAIYEVLPIDDDFVREIRNNTHNINQILKNKQIKTLAENAIEILKQGETSLEEIYPLLMN